MSATQEPFPRRPLWRRQYGRFLDWLWFGPLTRDLHPHHYPTRLQSLYHLIADVIWHARSPFLPDKEASDAAGTRPLESEKRR